jgi:lambda family phage tail tape measure protein
MLAESIFGQGFKGGGWLSALTGGISSLFGGGATMPSVMNLKGAYRGSMFGPSGLIPFGSGGIVNRPTIFPFASGGVGVMGERGPEAVMPLKRTASGELGVKSEGSEASSINIYISAVDAQSFQELTARNPEAIYGPVIDSIRRGNRNLISSIRMIK